MGITDDTKFFVALIRTDKGLRYGGLFTDRELIEGLCEKYNKDHEQEGYFADFINVTGEINDTFAFEDITKTI